MKILIVEDKVEISDRLVEFLQECDSTAVVEHSAEGLRSRIVKEKGFNLVVLDLLLGQEESIEPALNNIEAIRKRYPYVPILIFSEHAQKEWIDQVKNVGATDLLQKPPRITRDYFKSVFLPKLHDVAQRNIAFDLREVMERLQSLSEDPLIKRVIIPLFRHLGYNNSASIPHHGPGEFGMDVLPFYEIDKISRRRIYLAAQVKAGNINARSGSSGHVQSVMDQASAALKKEFLDDNGQWQRIDRLLIICSGKVTPNARAIIDDWLENNPRISLVDGTKLVNLLFDRELVYLLDETAHPLAVDVIACRIDIYTKKIPSWEQLLKTISHEVLDLEGYVADEIYKKILKRERMIPTVIGGGFAQPHAYDTRLERHKVLICVTAEEHEWAVLEPRGVSCAVLYLFTEKGKEAGLIRESVGAIIGQSMASKYRVSMNEMAWLTKTQAALQDSLSDKGFEVSMLPIRKLKI